MPKVLTETDQFNAHVFLRIDLEHLQAQRAGKGEALVPEMIELGACCLEGQGDCVDGVALDREYGDRMVISCMAPPKDGDDFPPMDLGEMPPLDLGGLFSEPYDEPPTFLYDD